VNLEIQGGNESMGKEKSPLDILIDQFDQMGPGQRLMYTLAPMYGPEIIIVEANKDADGKQAKFAVVASPPVDGKPGPARHTIWETNKAKAIAKWLLGRNAKPFAA
jgi:hypothetical protein